MRGEVLLQEVREVPEDPGDDRRGPADALHLPGALHRAHLQDRLRDVGDLHLAPQRLAVGLEEIHRQDVQLHPHPPRRTAAGLAEVEGQVAQALQGLQVLEGRVLAHALEDLPHQEARLAPPRHHQVAGLEGPGEVVDVDVLDQERGIEGGLGRLQTRLERGDPPPRLLEGQAVHGQGGYPLPGGGATAPRRLEPPGGRGWVGH
jgi:hypothetical protein